MKRSAKFELILIDPDEEGSQSILKRRQTLQGDGGGEGTQLISRASVRMTQGSEPRSTSSSGHLVCRNLSTVCVCVCVYVHVRVCVCVTQSRPILCDPTDNSPPGSSVHGILQARILEWVASPFCRGSSRPRDQSRVSCIAGRFFTI